MRARRFALAAVLLLAGCAAEAPTAAPASPAPSSGTALMAALARVADTEGTRERFEYSEIAFLGTVTAAGWADVRYTGARNIVPRAALEAGLPIDAAAYAISAGREPGHVIVFAGGQDATAVSAGLQRLGWTADGGRFLAPPLAQTPAPSHDGGLVPLGQARHNGADLLVGGRTADLTDATPAGRPTLAARPAVAALTACLGDVVAAKARFATHSYLAVAAAGVRRPAAGDTRARAVLCTATSSPAAARTTADTLRQAFATGRFPQLYTDVTVTVLDGPEHVVRVETTSAEPNTMLYAFSSYGLPGEVGQGA